jgi:hypothetical protein
MTRVIQRVLVYALFSTAPLIAGPFQPLANTLSSLRTSFTERAIAFHDLQIVTPASWQMKQAAKDRGTEILRFSKGNAHLHFFSRPAGEFSPEQIFTEDSTLVENITSTGQNLLWNMVVTNFQNGEQTVSVAGFWTEISGRIYYGYATVPGAGLSAKSVAKEFLSHQNFLASDSLTDPDYKGEKYYFGFGAAEKNDPSMMHNEVKYDVNHTHNIFTKEIGGNYKGSALTSYKETTKTAITKKWAELKNVMKEDDMYVQYSSGHGEPTGLLVGVTYNQIRDTVLSFNIKETIIFIMACHSGGLVEAFDRKKAEWKDFPSKGKTLFVMASSKTASTSSVGPGTDPEEPGGPKGSAGSAFGHALWKSLIGHADGAADGVKDGYLSLEEIQIHTTKVTKKVGGHSPVFTGAYDPKLIMNRVPPKAFLDSLEASSEGLSENELSRQIEELDAALRIR